MASNFEIKKTTKEKDSVWIEKYQYYFKTPANQDVVNDMFAVKQDAQPQ